jgi:hypothetical protein
VSGDVRVGGGGSTCKSPFSEGIAISQGRFVGSLTLKIYLIILMRTSGLMPQLCE